jgi:hypothetical protein
MCSFARVELLHQTVNGMRLAQFGNPGCQMQSRLELLKCDSVLLLLSYQRPPDNHSSCHLTISMLQTESLFQFFCENGGSNQSSTWMAFPPPFPCGTTEESNDILPHQF